MTNLSTGGDREVIGDAQTSFYFRSGAPLHKTRAKVRAVGPVAKGSSTRKRGVAQVAQVTGRHKTLASGPYEWVTLSCDGWPS